MSRKICCAVFLLVFIFGCSNNNLPGMQAELFRNNNSTLFWAKLSENFALDEHVRLQDFRLTLEGGLIDNYKFDVIDLKNELQLYVKQCYQCPNKELQVFKSKYSHISHHEQLVEAREFWGMYANLIKSDMIKNLSDKVIIYTSGRKELINMKAGYYRYSEKEEKLTPVIHSNRPSYSIQILDEVTNSTYVVIY
ncbi:hypothetical protein [Paenibacillus assamensis]|uniref:hypothetical protein n=1 Tax=Paenibacillus assamensis TaxID=311244 RepID=UPI00048C45E0|nr:hypothetical protein [Paenibacillus assamensis]